MSGKSNYQRLENSTIDSDVLETLFITMRSVVELPFYSVENCLETLFDDRDNDRANQEFLEKTLLKDVEYKRTGDLFIAWDKSKSEESRVTVEFSNRSHNNKELRGKFLENFINENKNKKEYKNKTIGAVVLEKITNPNDPYSTAQVLIDFAVEQSQIPREQVVDFVNLVNASVKLNKKNNPDLEKVTLKDIKENDVMADKAIENTDFKRLYVFTEQLHLFMKDIEKKKNNLAGTKFVVGKKGLDKITAIDNLTKAINAERETLRAGGNIQTFKDNILDALTKSEPALSKHRGGLLSALARLFGKETDSIRKVRQIKRELGKVKTSVSEENFEENKEANKDFGSHPGNSGPGK